MKVEFADTFYPNKVAGSEESWDVAWAKATKVEDDEEGTMVPIEANTVEEATTTTSHPTAFKPSGYKGTWLGILIGSILAFTAMAAVAVTEVGGIVVYGVALGMYHTIRPLAYILLPIDSLLLIIGVLVSEILGAVAMLLCTIMSGCNAGFYWHDSIRRRCHVLRWIFRKQNVDSPPARGYPFFVIKDKEQPTVISLEEKV